MDQCTLDKMAELTKHMAREMGRKMEEMGVTPQDFVGNEALQQQFIDGLTSEIDAQEAFEGQGGQVLPSCATRDTGTAHAI